MNRRGFIGALPALGLAGAGMTAGLAHAHDTGVVTTVLLGIDDEALDAFRAEVQQLFEGVPVTTSVKDAQYDELAGMILALDEMKTEHPSSTDIHSLFRFEVNGYCAAMRRAYPEDQLVNFDLAWAKERANGRVPLSPDSTEYGMWAPHYVLVEPSERSAEVERRNRAMLERMLS